jgi:hypothetical protein
MVLDVPVWNYRRETVREQLNGIVHAQVCVVGLGGSGLAALDELRARGVDAVLAVGVGAAGRNGRTPGPAVAQWPLFFASSSQKVRPGRDRFH